MKARIKNLVSQFGLTLFTLLAAVFLIVGCATTDPLADSSVNWTFKPFPGFEFGPQGHNTNHLDRAIIDDYEGYIKKHDLFTVGAITGFYEDGAGQHAVKFRASYALAPARYYVLIYNKENKRIKVIKYGPG
jgi:hypothetical protein